MSASFPIPVFWGQMFLQGVHGPYRPLMAWLYLLGEPMATIPPNTWLAALIGGLITWVKVISLFCLLGWVASWLSASLKERTAARGTWLDYASLAALVGGVGAMLLRVMETNQRVPVYKIGGIYSVTLLAAVCLGVLFLWVENAVWSAIRRLGRRSDVAVLFGIHLALAVGVAFGFGIRASANALSRTTAMQLIGPADALVIGVRMSATYMGYVVLLRVVWMVAGEVLAVRLRRIFAIARVSVIESNRRMWAPWVVITVFVVILAFTHWFLQPPRPAEMGRLFVGTLTLLCSLLLTVMVTLLTPLSLPQDIQNQTIFTVVSKPVRRIELIWGRMLGFMTIVTALVLVFGAISLVYLWRTVGGAIAETDRLAARAAQSNRVTESRQLKEQADQIRTRMAARDPVFGALSFLDSKGVPHVRGIDVGQEQSMREPRSHIEGGTAATAIWNFGIVSDPIQESATNRRVLIDRRIPVDTMLGRDTVEGLLDRTYQLRFRITDAEQRQSAGDVASGKIKDLTATITATRDELQRANDAYNKRKAEADGLDARAAEAEKGGRSAESQALRRQAAALHSPPVPLEMTFNVYRTTKGRVGEPIYARLDARNPVTGAEYSNNFPIREYYTNKQALPASLLAGSNGSLRIEVRCLSSTQYLGMSERDLFLLSHSGDFGTNFMKGLFGIWLQAMVLTAIGVFAGTFLSWPVALLMTISFCVAGQVAFAFLLDFTNQTMLGGGPFESLIRLLSHDNQMSELAPTLAVVTAKTLDALVMPVMSRLVYVVPNFAALDVTNTVADGFAVPWPLLGSNFLLALAYALPFSIAGYFILKNREVAA